MLFYFLIFLYVGTLGYLVQLYYKQNDIKTKYNSKIPLFAAVLMFALPVFLIGMRTGFGDTYAYINGFNDLTTDFSELWSLREETKGFGFKVYQFAIKKFISDDPNVYLMITATFHACGILRLYYKYSTNFTYSMLLFFFSMAFLYMMNGMRQFFAACLIFLFSDFLFEKKTVKFMLVVLVAITIHSSAIVWIPIYFIVQGKPWNAKVLMSIVAIAVAIFALDNFTDLLSDSLEGTNYEGYTNQFAKDDGSSIMHTLIAAVPAGLALWKRKEIEEKNDKVAFILVNCVVVEVLINLMANFTSGILVGRLPIYFKPLGFVLLPWIFDNVISDKDKRMVQTLCMLGYLMYAVYYMRATGISYSSSVLGIYV